MMPLGSAEVGLGASGLGLEIEELLCRVEGWEENLSEEVKRETNEMAQVQALRGMGSQCKPLQGGVGQRTFRNKSVLLSPVPF